MIPGVYTLPELQQAIAANPTQWRPLVFTNGCFDLLHVGHSRYLRVARSRGQALVVGLNSDTSVRQLKSGRRSSHAGSKVQPPRPIVPEQQRAEILASLKWVDGVVIFSEPNATHLVETLQPDIYVKGGDYTLETLLEAPAVQAYGGSIELVRVEIPTSTTALIDRILQSAQPQHG